MKKKKFASVYIREGSDYEKKFLETVRRKIENPVTFQVMDGYGYAGLIKYTLREEDLKIVKGFMTK